MTAAVTATAASTPATMESWLRRYATQATAVLALVVGVSGVMMFFHLGQDAVEGLHEWLGMAFAVAAGLHALRHRHGVAAMMGQPRTRVLFAAAAIATVAFVVLPAAKGPNPFHQATEAMMRAPLKNVAPVLGIPEQELTARLRAAGFAVADTTLSLDTIARSQNAHPAALMAAALKK
ncbi:MAG: DUF4405 domain-containing protein [Bacteroidota bacterium]